MKNGKAFLTLDRFAPGKEDRGEAKGRLGEEEDELRRVSTMLSDLIIEIRQLKNFDFQLKIEVIHRNRDIVIKYGAGERNSESDKREEKVNDCAKVDCIYTISALALITPFFNL